MFRVCHGNASLALVLLVVATALVLAPASVSARTVEFLDCDMPHLPYNVSSIGYLQPTGEFHFGGEYLLNVTDGYHNISIHALTEDYVMRVYTAPYSEVDIDLYMYKLGDDKYRESSGLGFNGEEVLALELKKGSSYQLHIKYLGTWKLKRKCPSTYIEMQMVPKRLVTQRVSLATGGCPAGAKGDVLLPKLDIAKAIKKGEFHYDSDKDPKVAGKLFVKTKHDAKNKNAIKELARYNFTMPAIKGSKGFYHIKVKVGVDFLTGNTLNALLIRGNVPKVTTTMVAGCHHGESCSASRSTELGHKHLNAALEPGTYTLFVYDVVGEKLPGDPTVCTPFQFKMDATVIGSPETEMNCLADRFPASFNDPGYMMENNATMSFLKHFFLDPSKQRHDVKLSVATESRFRLWISEHDIDLDVYLMQKDKTIARSTKSNEEESITVNLAKGDYIVSFRVFGMIEDTKFCDTIPVQLALAPTSAKLTDVCKGAKEAAPDLSGIDKALKDKGKYMTPKEEAPGKHAWTHVWTKAKYDKVELVKQAFTITEPMSLVAYVGSDFLLADVELLLTLHAEEDGEKRDEVSMADHYHNAQYFRGVLEPGKYTLLVRTPPLQSPVPDLSKDWPACFQYTLWIDIVRPEEERADQCRHMFHMPSTFNQPGWLGEDGIMHFAGDVHVNLLRGQMTATAETEFTVPAPSTFRAYTEPHHVDIDIRLYEKDTTGTPIARSEGSGTEESIVAALKPNTKYIYVVSFIDVHIGPYVEEDCQSYRMEVAIERNDQLAVTKKCGKEILPPTTLLKDAAAKGKELKHRGVYQYTQGLHDGNLDTFNHIMNFTLTKRMAIAAYVDYDFMWNDLVLLVRSHATEGEQQWSIGRNVYDRNVLETQILEPGEYFLALYEPHQPPKSDFRCVSFTFAVYLETAEAAILPKDLLGCAAHQLPYTMDGPSGLHPLSGYMAELNRHVRIAESGTDKMLFTVPAKTPMLLRMMIPSHWRVDIDMALYSAKDDKLIDESVAEYEEAMLVRLDPGNYYVKMTYIGRSGTDLPPAAECVSFDMALSLAPVSYLTSVPSLTTKCTTAGGVTEMQLNKFHYSILRIDQTKPFTATATFEVKKPSIFFGEIGSEFLSGAFSVTMNRYSSSDPSAMWLDSFGPSHLTVNHQMLTRVIPPGYYKLEMHDLLDDRGKKRIHDLMPEIKCSRSEFLYYIASDGKTDPDVCDRTQWLPENLWDEAQSAKYGGPAAADGSVRILGEHFNLPQADPDGRPERKDDRMLFKIHESSAARFWARFDGSENDIDFFVYNSTTPSDDSLVKSFRGVSGTESGVVALEPLKDKQGKLQPYLLVIEYYRVSDTVACNQMSFMMAVETATHVAREVSCTQHTYHEPALPPASIHVKNGASHTLSADNWVFRPEWRKAHSSLCWSTFEMQIAVGGNATIAVDLGFDFVSTNFQLSLINHDDHTPHFYNRSSIAEPSPTHDSYINMYEKLVGTIPTGLYRLRIRENMCSRALPVPDEQMCQRFELSIDIQAKTSPHVVQVEPAEGQNLDATKPLVLSFTFSEPVGTPSEWEMLDTIIKEKAVFLALLGDHRDWVDPSDASLLDRGTKLELTFPAVNLTAGSTYVLGFDWRKSVFKTLDGKAFQRDALRHEYHFTKCDCHGHGKCVTDSDSGLLHCECEAKGHWAGDDCLSCVAGYHFGFDHKLKKTACLPDAKCDAKDKRKDCNGHGNCSDKLGYLECSCDTGYVTPGRHGKLCGDCAPGYHWNDKKTKCVLSDERRDRELSCTAPVLPTTLNSPAFLGTDGHVHMIDNYFIDVDHRRHEIIFTLTRTSILRLFIAPHRIDVDVYLYQLVTKSGTTKKEKKLIGVGNSFGDEESIFRLLDGSDKVPTEWMIRFSYYNWDKTDNDACETFNMELAIEPMADSHRGTEAVNHLCKASKDTGPKGVLPEVPPLDLKTTNKSLLYFHPHTDFNVKVHTNHSWTPPGSADKSRYFWHYSFTAPHLRGHVPHLEAAVSYRYLTGDVALLLHEGEPDQSLCESQSLADTPRCNPGVNSWNTNTLSLNLVPGRNYTLWLMQPSEAVKELTKCTPFNLDLDIKWERQGFNDWNCPDGRRLPTTFDEPRAPGYIDNCTGVMHMQDMWLMNLDEGTHSINFTIHHDSQFRVHVPGHEINVNLVLYDMTNPKAPQQVAASTSPQGQADVIFEKLDLADGKTERRFRLDLLYITPFGPLHPDSPCEEFNMEVALLPVKRRHSRRDVFAYPWDACPAGGDDHLPNFGPDGIVVPTMFGFDHERFYSFQQDDTAKDDRVIAVHSFTIRDETTLFAAVSSDFLFGSVDLVIETTLPGDRRVELDSTHLHNFEYVYAHLEAGTYKIKLLQTRPSVPHGPQCVAFEFMLYLNTPRTSKCRNLIPLPKSLNTMQYLGWSGQAHVSSPDYSVPQGHIHSITFSVRHPSMLRVWTEDSPVNIDLELYQGRHLVTKSMEPDGEETVIQELKPSITYKLDIHFHAWSSDLPECPRFNMQLAIRPWDELLEQNCKACPNGHNRMPQLPVPVLLPPQGRKVWHYDTIEHDGRAWIQQVPNQPFAKNFTLTLAKPARIAVELGYDFMVSDLAVRMWPVESWGKGGPSESVYGTNRANANVLLRRHVPPGNYIVQVYEPQAPGVNFTGCAYFSFRIAVQAEQLEHGRTHYASLPHHLNHLPYLALGEGVHLSDEFEVPPHSEFWNIPSLESNMVLDKPMLFRMFTEPHRLDIDLELFNNTGPHSRALLAESKTRYLEETILAELPKGNYTVLISFYPGPDGYFPEPGETVGFAMQLSLEYQDTVKKMLATKPKTCKQSAIPKQLVLSKEGNAFINLPNAFVTPDMLEKHSHVMRTKFTLKEPSLFYAYAGYDFLLNDLVIYLNGSLVEGDVGDQKRINKAFVGDNRRDENELFRILPAGDYNLTVASPAYVKGDLKHCADVQVLVAVVNSTQADQQHICMSNEVMPSQLDTTEGGSVPFGGPMVDGHVHLHGSKFRMHDHGYDEVFFTVKEDTLIRVFTSSNEQDAPVGLSLFINSTKGEEVQHPYSGDHTLNQAGAWYLVKAKTPTQLGLRLTYEAEASAFIACPSYTMELEAWPYWRKSQRMLCDDGAKHRGNPLPVKLDFSKDKHIGASFIEGTLNSVSMAKTKTSEMDYRAEIEFKPVAELNTLDVDMAYDFLANDFDMHVERRSQEGDWERIGQEADHEALTEKQGEITFSSGLHSYVTNHTMRLVVTERKQIFPETMDDAGKGPREFCYPFSFNMLVMPTGIPTVRSINPPGGVDLSPDEGFTLSFHMSTAVYDDTKHAIGVGLPALQTLINSFYLTDVKDASVRAHAWLGYIHDERQFELYWPSVGDLKRDHAYTLALLPGKLFDRHGKEFILPSQEKGAKPHKYRFASGKCSGHGKIADGICQCNVGYAGVECGACDYGYVGKAGTHGKSLVCVKNTKFDCHPTSCGCKDPTMKTSCPEDMRLGTCKNNWPHPFKCKCAAGFAGSTCNLCDTDNGYAGAWPSCYLKKECQGGCSGGNWCDARTGKCVCPPQRTGSHCETCADGYGGKDCHFQQPWFWTVIKGAEVVGVVAALGLIVFGVSTFVMRQRGNRHSAYHKVFSFFQGEGGHQELHTIDDDADDVDLL